MDNRRIVGPEQSTPYLLYAKSKHKKVILREDGRKPEEMRKIYVKTNVISQAKGSAYMECGNTKVIVSVFDPREIPNKNEYSLKGELYCEFKFAPFSCLHRRTPQPDAQEKEYSVIFKRALESTVCRLEFPNFQVDIYALVLENDGSALSAAITCAGIALAQAGVPMYDTITCVTVGLHDNCTFLDPTLLEENICSTPADQKILNYYNLKLNVESQVKSVKDLISDSENLCTDSDELDVTNKKASRKIIKSKENLEENTTAMDTSENMSERTNNIISDCHLENGKKISFEHGLVTLSMLQTHKQVTEFYQTGSMSLETIKKLTNLLAENNNQMIPIVQSSLLKYVKESLKNT